MRLLGLSWLGLLLVVTVAGCPQPATVDSPQSASSSGIGSSSFSDDTDSARSDTSSAVGSAGTTVGPSTPSGVWDSFSAEFPGCEEPIEADAWRTEILRLVNVERAKVGVAEVVYDPVLEMQATQYACEMIYYEFFDHANPVTGSTLADRAEEFGYEFWMIGENLAAGQPTPEKAVSDWMHSPDHRDNLLNPAFTELGVGVRVGGPYRVYWVQEFGRPFAEGPYAGP